MQVRDHERHEAGADQDSNSRSICLRQNTDPDPSRFGSVTCNCVQDSGKGHAQGTQTDQGKARENTKGCVDAVKAIVKEKKGKTTMRGLAREFDMTLSTMQTLVKDDLNPKTFKRTPRQALEPIDCNKRLAVAKKCLNKLKKKLSEYVIVHLDEMPFSLSQLGHELHEHGHEHGHQEQLQQVPDQVGIDHRQQWRLD